MLTALPRARRVTRIYMFLMLGFSIGEMVLHLTAPALASAWFDLSRPLTDFMARYILAIDQVSALVANTPYADRAPVMANFIAFSWMMTLLAIVAGVIAVLIDFHADENAASLLIDRLWKADRDPGLMIMGYLLLGFAGFALLFTIIGYVALYRAYTTDLSFPLIAYLFYGFAVSCILLVAIAIAARKTRDRSPADQQNEA